MKSELVQSVASLTVVLLLVWLKYHPPPARYTKCWGLTDRHLLDVAIPHRLGLFEPGRLEFEFLHAAQLLTRFDEVDRGDGRAGMLGQRGEGLQGYPGMFVVVSGDMG